MRAPAAGVPGLNRYREPRVWWRHGSHGAARREVQAGARLTTFEPTANADEKCGDDCRSGARPALSILAVHSRVLGSLPDPLF